MSVRERASADASDSVDLSATLELLASLTQYAEAGAVQPHTLAQAAQHALEEHGDRVEILVAVAKLHLATGQKDAARRVLGRAFRAFPGDSRLEPLMNEAGFETVRPSPLSARNPGGSRRVDDHANDEPAYGTSVRRRATPREVRSPEPPPSAALSSSTETSGSRARAGRPPGEDKGSDAHTPATPRPGVVVQPRPTVKMARVAASPERQRWGKSDGREPLDSRPAFDSRPDLEPSSVSPRSVRSAQRQVLVREAAHTPSSPIAHVGRDHSPTSRRAATGNLKLLDPHSERRHLDRYELIGEIASGGMASVFLARLAGVAGFQRFYAIKRLHPHLADEQEFIEMFLDEARLAAGIHHPNVVPILEVGTTEAGYYLVMDYIEGDTLAGVIARASTMGSLPRPIALRIILDALHGLHAAHELTDGDGHLVDLVHRDCSPQNILVGVDGASRITDFGVARASSRLSTTRSATVKGKLAYLSPEQATGRPLDRRSDLFGMGVILWEALTGTRLFRADSEGATLSRILVDPIPLVTDFIPDIPDRMAQLVAIALARNADDRFATAADMADAIERCVREVGTTDLFVASPRDVGNYMRELFNFELAARRETVRAWIAASTDAEGPQSQSGRRGSPAPPSVRGGTSSKDSGPTSVHGRSPEGPPSERSVARSNPDLEPRSDAPASDAPSTKKEASVARAAETTVTSMKAQPVPAPASAPKEPEPAEDQAPPASAHSAGPTDPTSPEAPSPLRAQRAATREKRQPVALIALTALVLIVLTVLVVKALG